MSGAVVTSTASRPRYILISPVKDEARHIELTLRSVTEQVLKPLLWIIVDDGSQDGTAEIVERYAAEHSYIRPLATRQTGSRHPGRAGILAFYQGFESVRGTDFDFVVKLDGDLSFGPDYFQKLLGRFHADATLGIASGVYLEVDKAGSWKIVGMPPYHAFGACKVVRRQCFEDISGFPMTPGWDTADEVRAWNRGWKTCHFRDLPVKHHKPEGVGMGWLRTSRMHGEIYYVTGGDPVFLAFKLLHRARLKPYVIGALAVLFGYVYALVRRKPLLVTPEEAATYSRLLRQRLLRLVRSPFRSTEFRT